MEGIALTGKYVYIKYVAILTILVCTNLNTEQWIKGWESKMLLLEFYTIRNRLGAP